MRLNLNREAAITSLRDVAKRIDGSAAGALKEVVDLGVSHAKMTSLFRDGVGRGRRLRSQTRRVVVTRDHVQLRNDSPHAKFVEGGTRPHTISAWGWSTSGGAGRSYRAVLRFKVNGSWVFARSVQHPGTSPRPFMAQAAAYAEKWAPAVYELAIERALTGG